MNKKFYLFGSLAMCLSLSMASCSDDDPTPDGNGADPIESDGKYVGQAVATSLRRNGIRAASLAQPTMWLQAATRTRLLQ